jgi:hypothetical protein
MTQTRKTRHEKHSRKVHKTALQTIPELRKSFDYIDEFVKNRIVSGVPKEQLVKEVQREWLRVFSKRLQKKNATAFVEHLMEQHSRRRSVRGTRRRVRGGVAPFMNPTTQAGVYLASGTPPTASGQYPMANGAPSAYGSLTAYISRGFENPEIAATQDPIKGQSVFPTQPPPSMGSNLVRGGDRGTRKRNGTKGKRHGTKGGSLAGSLLAQAFRPQSSAPPSILQDAHTAWMGRSIGPSPDQIQRQAPYQINGIYPSTVNMKIDV